jgi:hypothetical protein
MPSLSRAVGGSNERSQIPAVEHLYAHQNIRDRRPQANALDLLFDRKPGVGEAHCDTAPASRRRQLGVSPKVDAEKPEIGTMKTLTGIP